MLQLSNTYKNLVIFLCVAAIIGAAMYHAVNASVLNNEVRVMATSGLLQNRQSVQKITIYATDRGYSPNKISLQKDVPAELTVIGNTYSCASNIAPNKLWSDTKIISFGNKTEISFTPKDLGSFQFECTGGLFGGVIEVV